MATIALYRRVPELVLPSRQPLERFRSIVGASRLRLRQDDWRQRLVRVRGCAGEGGPSEKEEADGDNGKSGATVAEPGGSIKGFGGSARPGAAKPASKDKKKAATVRRSAPEKPLIQSAPADNQVSQLETAYVVSLAFLFGLIFIEGIALAASGFLPEEWDQFFVNTLYPSFTPTVGLFLLLAAGYGVFKYLGLDGTQK